jgi:hypothetical protein
MIPPPNGKTVVFTAPTYHEHSGYEYSTEGGEEGEFDDDEYQEGDGFDDDDEEEEGADEGETVVHVKGPVAAGQKRPAEVVEDDGMDAGDEADRNDWEEEQRRRARAQAGQNGRPDDRAAQEQQQQQQARQLAGKTSLDSIVEPLQNGRASPKSPGANDGFVGIVGTRKISLTPQIARDEPNNTSPQRQRSGSPFSSQQQQLQQQRSVSPVDRFEPGSVEGAESLHSVSTSVESNGFNGSDEGHDSAAGSSNKKLKKDKNKDDKKKSGGGMFSGLFGRNKKDKKSKKGGADGEGTSPTDLQSSEDSTTRGTSPVQALGKMGSADSQDDIFGTTATLKQQQKEAQQAMYQQYGIQRVPGEQTNVTTFNRQSPPGGGAGQSLSPPVSATPVRPVRPGSLIGSPGVPGLDMPLLSVLRVFAGDHITAEATFKTVLLNKSTTTADLVKQSLQRFHLPADRLDDYYLTIKGVGGDETVLGLDQSPLTVFEELSEAGAQGGAAIPAVKRSSVGSVSSVNSNLSLHPAITRLGMNDFSDDSAVKFFINRRTQLGGGAQNQRSGDQASTKTSSGGSLDPWPPLATTGNASGPPGSQSSTTTTATMRFALRVVVYSSDLPEGMVFDPHSQAIVSPTTLSDRSASSPPSSSSMSSSTTQSLSQQQQQTRERIILFPSNTSVAEVIETSLDRFGIMDGVVDGGDEVEDKLTKRRSVSRVRYCLALESAGGPGLFFWTRVSFGGWGTDGKCTGYTADDFLNPSSKVLDAYTKQPIFRPHERGSKEGRRRSADVASLLLGSPSDIQPGDPVFVLRKASARTSLRHSRLSAVDELEQRQRPEPQRSLTDSSALTADSYETPSEGEPLSPTMPPSRQEIIAAQRAASRANQRAMLSAQKNTEQGVDILLKDRATLRSSRNLDDHRVRYSYIDQDGAEFDISEIVQSEWSRDHDRPAPAAPSRNSSFRSEGGSSTGSERTLSGRGSYTTTDDGSEDRSAIEALKTAPLSIDSEEPPSQQPPTRLGRSPGSLLGPKSGQDGDFLEEALQRQRQSPFFDDTLEQRIDRVLAKVKSGGSSSSVASSLRNRRDQRPRQTSNNSQSGRPPSGRSSPSVATAAAGRTSPLDLSRSTSPTAPAPAWCASAASPSGRASPSVRQATAEANQRNPPARRHGHQDSVASGTSDYSTSNTTGTTSPSTPVTTHSAPTTVSPATRNGSSLSQRVAPTAVYRDDMGLDTLGTLIEHGGQRRRRPVKRDREPGADDLFGPSLDELGLQLEVREWFGGAEKALEDIASVSVPCTVRFGLYLLIDMRIFRDWTTCWLRSWMFEKGSLVFSSRPVLYSLFLGTTIVCCDCPGL